MKSVQTASPIFGHREKEIERNKFAVARGEDVIGRLAVVRLEKGDTLPDIARHYNLGINEIRGYRRYPFREWRRLIR